VRGKQEGIVEEDVVDDVYFLLVFILVEMVYRNLIAEYLCCGGWLDVYGISVSVKVGFL